MNTKVVFKNVSKKFIQTGTQKENLKNLFFKRDKKEFLAVDDVSFSVMSGETVGLIGINGSGKSTISNMISKVIPPSAGEVWIDGQPSLISISAGLNGSLTGKENVYLKCLMMGLTNKDIDKIYPSIVEFSEIGDFIDQPLKTYSSGMRARLGFAISVHIEPDILVVDEALSVGDQTFGKKCEEKILNFKESEKTIFFVSHSLDSVKQLCDRVMWIHAGNLISFGPTEKVIAQYTKFSKIYTGLSMEERKVYTAEILRKKRSVSEDGLPLPRSRIKKIRKTRKFFPVDSVVLVLLALTIVTSGLISVFDTPVLGKESEQQENEVVEVTEEVEVEEEIVEGVPVEEEIVEGVPVEEAEIVEGIPVEAPIEGPVISFESDYIILEEGSPYDLKVGMTIQDDTDTEEQLMQNVKMYADPIFDVNIPGVYVITYEVTNSAGETAIAERTFEVVPAASSD